MPVDLTTPLWPSHRQAAPPKIGRPHRDRAKNKAQRRARKRTR